MNFNIQELMKQAKAMQDEMAKSKEKLSDIFVEAESGGGMVKVKLNCNYDIKSIEIADEIISKENKEMLEDLIVAAINSGVRKASDKAEEEGNKIKSMLPNIPGFNL